MSSKRRRRSAEPSSQPPGRFAGWLRAPHFARPIRLLALLMLGLVAVAGFSAGPQDLSQQLQQLAQDNKFTIVGIQKIAAAPGRTASGTLKEQVRLLLENYNHILVGDGAGGVERVIILGAKQPVPEQPAADEPGDEAPGETVLTTVRENSHHLVEGVVVGINGTELPTRMTVDTGATLVVLPESFAQRLGYQLEKLATQEVRTANGPASAHIATLPTLRLGGIAVGDVDIAFIGDEQLGGTTLLGMSALGRFQITLDDEHNQLTLVPKN